MTSARDYQTRTDGEAAPSFASGEAGGNADEEPRPRPAFPHSDEALTRTLVYDHPSATKTTQILVTVWASGDIEIAERPHQGASWAAPWTLKEVESW